MSRTLGIGSTLTVFLLGVFLPFWPLAALALLIASVWGEWVFALCMGIFLDLLWGTPPGFFHFTLLPWTLCACVVLSFRYIVLGRIRLRMPQRL